MLPKSQASLVGFDSFLRLKDENDGADGSPMNNMRKSSQNNVSGIASQNSVSKRGNSQSNIQRNMGQNENTFLTQTTQPKQQETIKLQDMPTHSLHDFLFPAGKVAKLV